MSSYTTRAGSLEKAFPEPAPPMELASRIGIFLAVPDGSRLALWDYGGDEPAVVLLESEGAHRNDFLAGTLPG